MKDLRKTHYSLAAQMKVLCGARVGYYIPLLLTADIEKVTCSKCRQIFERERAA
jgi:hypothetical protein